MLVSHNITEREGITARHYDGPDWRMVHDGVQVIALLPPGGLISTIQPALITGSLDELRAEANRLGLIPLPTDDTNAAP